MVCTAEGCHTLIPKAGRCEKHRLLAEKEDRQRRGTSTARGYDADWRKIRERQLRSEPLCRHHKDKGQLVTATQVDHIKPHRGDYALFRDPNNLQSLCASCHSIKTSTEDGGFVGLFAM